MNTRTIIAFMVAPLSPVLFVIVYTLLFGEFQIYIGSDPTPRNILFATIIMMVIFGYLAIVVIGAPIFYIFQKEGITKIAPYILVGAIAGLFVLVVEKFNDLASISDPKKLFWYIVFGIISSIVFWVIAKPKIND